MHRKSRRRKIHGLDGNENGYLGDQVVDGNILNGFFCK
jgi:hypothetical protein